MSDRAWQHPWLRIQRLILNPRGAAGRGDAPGDEKDTDGGAQEAREDPARRLIELVPSRRPAPEPTISLFPNQLHIGDRFMDTDTTSAEHQCEVIPTPVTFKQGHEVRASV